MTYEHLSDLDISKAVAKANGVKVSEAEEEVKPRIKICGKCKYTNAKDARYCGRCGGPQGIEIALQEDKDKEDADQLEALFIRDPKRFEEELAHKVLMGDYRRKRKYFIKWVQFHYKGCKQLNLELI